MCFADSAGSIADVEGLASSSVCVASAPIHIAASASHAVNPSLYKVLSYDPVRDFAAVSNVADVALVSRAVTPLTPKAGVPAS